MPDAMLKVVSERHHSIRKCHAGNDDRNKKVFSSRRKATYERTSRTNGGSEFQAFAVASGNDWSPIVERRVDVTSRADCVGRAEVKVRLCDGTLPLDVNVRTLDIAPLRSESPPQKRSGMARVLKGFHSFTCTPTRSSAIGMSRTCLCIPSYNWYSFTDPGGMEG